MSLIAALFAEFVLTAVLLIVVMSTAVYQRSPGGAMPAGLAIGLWIGCAVFLAFPVSGGSLNPARTLGPDIVSAAFPAAWIYIVGPLAGAAAGGWTWQYLKRGRRPAKPNQKAGARTPNRKPSARTRVVKLVLQRETGRCPAGHRHHEPAGRRWRWPPYRRSRACRRPHPPVSMPHTAFVSQHGAIRKRSGAALRHLPRAWDKARRAALSPEQYDSPLVLTGEALIEMWLRLSIPAGVPRS